MSTPTKMGRPKQEVVKDHTITVRLSEAEHRRLKEFSEKHHRTITETIKVGIELMYSNAN